MKLTFLALFIGHFAFGNAISEYFETYRLSNESDTELEIELIKSFNFDFLSAELNPYFSDSLLAIQQKAYYFIYKKVLIHPDSVSTVKAVNYLLDGCLTANSILISQNIDYLQNFSPTYFNETAKAKITKAIQVKKPIQYKKLIMLAGYVGAANEIMNKTLLQNDISFEKKWILSLAIARMGNSDKTNYCVNTIKRVPVNNDLVINIVPDLIYMRQKTAIDYCVDLLNSDTKACNSSDPDNPKSQLCGYRIMEMLAPIILDFPFKTDATGSIIASNYDTALKTVRTWFKDHSNYQLNKSIY